MPLVDSHQVPPELVVEGQGHVQRVVLGRWPRGSAGPLGGAAAGSAGPARSARLALDAGELRVVGALGAVDEENLAGTIAFCASDSADKLVFDRKTQCWRNINTASLAVA